MSLTDCNGTYSSVDTTRMLSDYGSCEGEVVGLGIGSRGAMRQEVVQVYSGRGQQRMEPCEDLQVLRGIGWCQCGIFWGAGTEAGGVHSLECRCFGGDVAR